MSTATFEGHERFHWGRSSAISVTIAVHAFAFLLMLAPPVAQEIARLVREPDIQVQVVEPKPPEPKVVELQPPPKFVKPQPKPRVTPVPTPPKPEVVATEPTDMSVPYVPDTTPTDIGPTTPVDTAPSPPAYGTIGRVPYPVTAVRAKQEGRVILRVLVGGDGRVEQIVIEKSSGYVALDRAAKDAVARWRFTPGTRNGQPYSAWGLVPIEFRLNEL